MNDASPVKRGLTIAWSIGISILLLGMTTVLLLPATKNARIRFDGTEQDAEDSKARSIEVESDVKELRSQTPKAVEPSQ